MPEYWGVSNYMTFGPADESKTGLSGSAADAFLAAQIGSEIRSAR